MTIWAAKWYSKSKLSGESIHLIYDTSTGVPALFRTRQQCRDFIRANYEYIKRDKSLREEPHGWRMPKPVKVEVREKREVW
jgi:hypothetical protein